MANLGSRGVPGRRLFELASRMTDAKLAQVAGGTRGLTKFQSECPICGGSTFSIWPDHKPPRWGCSGCGRGGGLEDLEMHAEHLRAEEEYRVEVAREAEVALRLAQQEEEAREAAWLKEEEARDAEAANAWIKKAEAGLIPVEELQAEPHPQPPPETIEEYDARLAAEDRDYQE